MYFSILHTIVVIVTKSCISMGSISTAGSSVVHPVVRFVINVLGVFCVVEPEVLVTKYVAQNSYFLYTVSWICDPLEGGIVSRFRLLL